MGARGKMRKLKRKKNTESRQTLTKAHKQAARGQINDPINHQQIERT
jgi:hypothetical protein